MIDNKLFHKYLLIKWLPMKNSLLIFFVILTSFFVRSQVSSYTFGTSTGTYTPIVGGINYDNFTRLI